MPFKSKAQQRFMHARHPKIAAKWDKETDFSKLKEFFACEDKNLKPEFEKLVMKYAKEIMRFATNSFGGGLPALADILRDFARDIEETEGEDTSDIEESTFNESSHKPSDIRGWMLKSQRVNLDYPNWNDITPEEVKQQLDDHGGVSDSYQEFVDWVKDFRKQYPQWAKSAKDNHYTARELFGFLGY